MDIDTIGDLKAAIRKANDVYITPVFFGFEREVKITKKEALLLIDGYSNKTTVENLCGNTYMTFAYIDSDNSLHLG